jgi:hypothetical protein
MGGPLFILSIGSVFSGFFLKDALVGFGSVFWGNTIYRDVSLGSGLDMEFLPTIIKNIPLALSLLGAVLGSTLNWFILVANKL